MKRVFILVLLVAMAACTAKRPTESSYEIAGTPSERIAAVTPFITKHAVLPTALQDARFVEEQIGDNTLGPADFSSFYALSVASADVAAWRSALLPLEAQNKPVQYSTPKKVRSWWLPASEFSTLEFYSPKLLTGRSNGWVAIQPHTGRIFIFAFTM